MAHGHGFAADGLQLGGHGLGGHRFGIEAHQGIVRRHQGAAEVDQGAKAPQAEGGGGTTGQIHRVSDGLGRIAGVGHHQASAADSAIGDARRRVINSAAGGEAMGEGGAVGPHQPQGAGRGLHHQPHIAVERQPLLAQTAATGHAAQRGLRGDQGGQGGELPPWTGGIGLEPHLGGLQVQGPGRLQAAGSQHLQHRGGGEGEGAVAG